MTLNAPWHGLNENSVSLTGYQFDVKSTVPTSFNFGSETLDAIPPIFVAPGNSKKIETAIIVGGP